MNAQESLILLERIKADIKRHKGTNNDTYRQLQILIKQIRMGESLEIQTEVK